MKIMSKTNSRTRKLYYSDNLPVLRDMDSESIDLIYLDPPFNSNKAYNIIYPDDLGQVTAFEDTWTWTPTCDEHLDKLKNQGGGVEILSALVDGLGKVQISAYLVNMAARLVELHRILRQSGSIYLHCDPTASHYLKILMDGIFGHRNFRNEIVWCYEKPRSAKKVFRRNHDIIFFYTKSKKWTFNSQRVPKLDGTFEMRKPFKRPDGTIWYPKEPGKQAGSWWYDIPSFATRMSASERLGYPTQKPVALLERIIKSSSNENDIVLDPFCGCGTTIAAAETLKRNWLGIDITFSAIAAIRERFKRQKLNIWGDIEVLNEPKTIQDVDNTLLNKASPLYARKEFEKFCVTLVGGLPNDKIGADGGIDGKIPLVTGEIAICSVKSGKVSVKHIRELKGLLDDSKNVAGVFLTREEPTKDMVRFANQAGRYKAKKQGLFDNEPFPKMQILTLAQMLTGRLPHLPYQVAA